MGKLIEMKDKPLSWLERFLVGLVAGGFFLWLGWKLSDFLNL